MQKLGKLQKKALKFYATHCSEWHSFENKSQTKKIIESLKNRGLLTVNEFNQAKVTNEGIFQSGVNWVSFHTWTPPQSAALDEYEILKYACEAYGYLIKRNEVISFREFSTRIQTHYSMEEPHNRKVAQTLIDFTV